MPHFINDYFGFYGQHTSVSGVTKTVCWRLGEPGAPFSGTHGAIQWVRPGSSGCPAPLPPTEAGQIFLAGLIWSSENSLQALSATLGASILTRQYEVLAELSVNAAGCLIATSGIYLWTGTASNDHAFFRVEGDQLSWSTNPLDLVLSQDDLHLWNLRRCCHGDDAFLYRQEKIQRVEQGHLVKIERDGNGAVRVEDMVFDRFLPDPHLSSGRLSRELVISRTREALQHSVRPLACGKPVGMMFSGGAGSAALLLAMKQAGVNVIAYHLEPEEPEASEYHFAHLACTALNIPLVRIPMSSGPDYLSKDWMFPHPDGHPWVRWYEQIADRAKQDQIDLLVTGAGDDHAFGPELAYGVHSILAARIRGREKQEMLRGLLSTDWNIYDILKSVRPGRQLIGLTHLAGPSQADHQMRRADFLSPLPPYTREIDAALFHSPVFTPQGMAVELTILQPRGIRLYYPYYHREIQALSLALPDAYRLMPAASLPPHIARMVPTLERVVDKPILRLACEGTALPQEVIWRTWGICAMAPIQSFCLNHTEQLWDILAGDSCLVQMGMLDPARLREVLASRARIRENYTSLVASALVEVFLKKAFREQCERGGPLWK